jgi:2-amino-4-hydroxy-6-hydroxymethyldihydropteridine diphosphokinase
VDPREKQLLVAFGANQPFGEMSPEAMIPQAAHAVAALFHAEMRISALYRTPCFPAGAGPDYVNAVAVVTLRHSVTPDQALQGLHAIEARFGRLRSTRWAARTLDIDLLAVGDAVLPDAATQTRWRDLPLADQARLAPDRLILPHPRLQDRAFVLVPMADVAAHWRHPVLGLTVADMLAALPEQARAEVVRLNPAASA